MDGIFVWKLNFWHVPEMLAVLLYFSSAVAVVSIERVDFQLVVDDRVTLVPLGYSLVSHSQLACAAACLRSSPLCTGFLFNTQSKFCTLGNTTVAGNSSRDTTRELLYMDSSCPTYLGFTRYTSGNGSMCYWLSPPSDTLNYTRADKSCRDKGQHLVTMKTLTKLHLFLEVVQQLNNVSEFWIGLNDIEEEKRFKWSDDGSDLALNWTIIFGEGQPKNWNGSEDCVQFSRQYYPCNDANCSGKQRYMCEALSASTHY